MRTETAPDQEVTTPLGSKSCAQPPDFQTLGLRPGPKSCSIKSRCIGVPNIIIYNRIRVRRQSKNKMFIMWKVRCTIVHCVLQRSPAHNTPLGP
jgi:hypothetical protein